MENSGLVYKEKAFELMVGEFCHGRIEEGGCEGGDELVAN